MQRRLVSTFPLYRRGATPRSGQTRRILFAFWLTADEFTPATVAGQKDRMARPQQYNLAALARIDGKPNPVYERRRRAVKSLTDGAVTTLLTSDTAEADARAVACALTEAGYKIAVLCDGNNWRLVVTTRPQN